MLKPRGLEGAPLQALKVKRSRGHGCFASIARRVVPLVSLLSLLSCNLARADTVYVARRSWHVDVGLAVADLSGELQGMARRFPRAEFLFFGFGARRYLTRGHHGSGNLLASVLPGAALILVTAIDGSPEEGFGAGHVVRLEVSGAEREALESQIKAAFEHQAQAPKTLEPGPYEESLYVEALPRYSALHTCNTWVAEILQRSGLPISSRGVVFAGQVWSRVKRLAEKPPTREGSRRCPHGHRVPLPQCDFRSTSATSQRFVTA